MAKKFVRTSYFITHLAIRDVETGSVENLETTDEHPFWVLSKGWTTAKNLEPGDLVLNPDGTYATVESSHETFHPEGVTVYNFEVEGAHTYFVADGLGLELESFVWVHNANYKSNDIMDQLGERTATSVHDEFVTKALGADIARQRVAYPSTVSKPQGRGRLAGSRVHDGRHQETKTVFEGNTTPWANATRDQVNRKLDQLGSDIDLLATDPNIKRIVWFGTEDLPDIGPAAEIKVALQQGGIPYYVVSADGNLWRRQI